MFSNLLLSGFEVKVVTDEKYTTAQSGLIYYDLVEGQGELPKDGQQVFTLPCLVFLKNSMNGLGSTRAVAFNVYSTDPH